MSYQIITDATADLTPELQEGLPPITVIPMDVTVGEAPYTYGPGGDLTVSDFYAAQRSGKFATTSQINPLVYTQYFEQFLSQGMDVIYLGLLLRLSGSFQNAVLSAEELREKYPERKLYCIDTLCASVGEGFLVCEAARKQAEGMGVDELAEWVAQRQLKVCHWFTVDTFEHLRHGGRVGAVSAALGTALQIKPLLHVTTEGTLEVAEKPRGSKRPWRPSSTVCARAGRRRRAPSFWWATAMCPTGRRSWPRPCAGSSPRPKSPSPPLAYTSHTGPVCCPHLWGTDRITSPLT